ncbi:hypothetical protein PN36_10820 [Candidatus Thiomargarita nelsonii]|uniref:Uncharacterized protein n=1 Tax=Candidatus Thiomargarita nelsonii TaxID=1003181 RepID=A0A0A6S3V5_9GAMM|nr:hypothetical protein PN36_10820 [Candidatus Thiomargarita nelsonii]
MEIIKTRYKKKLPKGKSYPIGAEEISQELKGIPQYSEIEIAFSIQDEFWASKYNKKLKEGGDIEVLEVHFGVPFYEWIIYVHSVPSEHKSTAKRQILDLVLPKLAKELKNIGINNDHFNFIASYSLASGSITL